MGIPLEKGRKLMRFTICLTAALAFCAASTPVAAKPAHFQLMSTSWSYVDHGTKVRQSVDAKGNYIENAVSGKHVDHGTAVMKGNKACFTSAMTSDGEMCWTTRPVAIGHSMHTVSDKGDKLTVTRVAYKPLSMPK
jgi:hypothetical protein